MRPWINRLSGIRLAAGLALMAASAAAQDGLPNAGSHATELFVFRLPDYHADGTLKNQMFGDQVRLEGNVVTVSNLRVEFYAAGKITTTFWGELCRYNRKTGLLTSDSPVRLTSPGLVMTGEGMDWKKGETVVTIHRNVRMVVARGTELFKREKRK